MVGTPRKTNAAAKGVDNAQSKTAKHHKKLSGKLVRTHTIQEAAKEGRAFIRKQNKGKAPAQRRRKVRRLTPIKVASQSPEKVKVEPVSPTKPVSPRKAPAVNPTKPPSPRKAPAVKKAKTAKRHVKAKPKLARSKTIQATLDSANAFLGKDQAKPEEKEVKKPQKVVKPKKAKLTRKSTIQQTVSAAKGYLKKSRRGKK